MTFFYSGPVLVFLTIFLFIITIVLYLFTSYHAYLICRNMTTNETVKWSSLVSRGDQMDRLSAEGNQLPLNLDRDRDDDDEDGDTGHNLLADKKLLKLRQRALNLKRDKKRSKQLDEHDKPRHNFCCIPFRWWQSSSSPPSMKAIVQSRDHVYNRGLIRNWTETLFP